MTQPHKPTEPKLDETVAGTFPASDPPSYMGATIAGGPKEPPRRHEDEAHMPVVKECISVDLNRATEEELGSLPALSPAHVKTLVEHRPFTGWEDLKALPDFDGGTIAALRKGGAHIVGD